MVSLVLGIRIALSTGHGNHLENLEWEKRIQLLLKLSGLSLFTSFSKGWKRCRHIPVNGRVFQPRSITCINPSSVQMHRTIFLQNCNSKIELMKSIALIRFLPVFISFIHSYPFIRFPETPMISDPFCMHVFNHRMCL